MSWLFGNIWLQGLILRIRILLRAAACSRCLNSLASSFWLIEVSNWYNIYTMEFEFDPEKSATNKRKHGIDFVEAQALWEDPDRLQAPARTQRELRFMLIGRIRGGHWSAIFTPRAEKIRIVSVRRSRTEEVDVYED